MSKRIYQNYTILNAKATTGAGTAVNVQDYGHLVIWLATDGGGDAALTVKIQGSISVDEPNWDSAQSVTNEWDYLDVKDLQDDASIDGDTGIAVATADDYRLLKVNNDGGLKWLNVVVTARSEGEITAKCKVSN